MESTQEKKNYKTTLNLPQTGFAMEAKLVQNEPKRLAMWQEGRLYEKMLTARAASPKGRWILHDGPPFANGDIHIGHVINKTLKDVILRFRTMEGYETPYVPGWDCHGLPIEHKIQEDVKKAGKDFRAMDKVAVRKLCYEYAEKYAKIQSEQFQRLGVLGDWANPYLTMKPEYEAETLDVFARFVEAGLVYKQLKPVPWSVASQTALADAELEYKDVTDPSVYVLFVVENGDRAEETFGIPQGSQLSYLIWTTTPWTLPANRAVAVHPDTEYSLVVFDEGNEEADQEMRIAVIATALIDRVMALRPGTSHRVFKTVQGRDLVGQKYWHLFEHRLCPIVPADYVTTADGTGLVHTAPGHGEDDHATGMREGLEVYSPVQANGRYDQTAPEWLQGQTVKDGNKLILDQLRQWGVLFAEQPITHSYPHDWRTKTPIIFRATEQWFVAVDKPFVAHGEPAGTEPWSLRDRAADACAGSIDFIPEWGKARIGGMLESRPDWCISRQRAWGLPIPVFYNEKGEALLTAESVRAVAKRVREKGSDVWFTETPTELLGCDQTVCPAHFGEVSKLRKENDIFDVWFESGSSWRSVLQCRSYLNYPADLYLEGSDQHRGWFQLSLLPALGATGQPPFKQVLTHGFIVKPDGTKVSKSDKEYVKAVDEINRHGADVLRLWCCSVDYQNDIPASPKALVDFADKYRKIRNTVRYLLSNLYDFNPRTDAQPVPPNSLDGWALAQVDELVRGVVAAYDAYQLHRAFRLLHDFCSVQISAIYGNAMKDRLYCEAVNAPLRRRSQTVMHTAVIALTKLLAPMIVYTADEAWEQIPHKPDGESDLASVHLALLPVAGSPPADEQKAEWDLLMKLREEGLGGLDKLKKEVGLNKSVDAEVIYEVADAAMRKKLEAYCDDMADLIGAGYHSFAEAPSGGAAVTVKVIDRRETYAACARSWKRRPDVGQDPQYPDLCLRDAEAVKAAGQ